ncbi:uncharacterized protein GIQ15_03474 [Arthroderma uncinatum]|uniref:uncharacterized protein n=1 Tax=Arthroderma uncinatum TaxID=74035 RepID=UPI00144AB068|nr:uncharacterized protein GIQ15_03474 [Arthroderma uncinatum]KAF3484150.1 hypothetical protein GIQ15_03474 [Arthroderma uncinatum]
MPIPTRSLSLREPQRRKQAVNGDSRSSSPTKQSQLPRSSLRRLTTSAEIQSDASTGLGIGYGNGNGNGNTSGNANGNGVAEKKSFLPQRRTLPRPQSLQIPHATVQSARLKQPESRLEIKSTKPKPAPAPTPTPTPSDGVRSRPSSRSRSPTKPEPKRALARPPGAAPLARSVRSSSLLHPPAPKLVTPASHSRHRSQIINFDAVKSRPAGSRPSSFHPSTSKLSAAPLSTSPSKYSATPLSKSPSKYSAAPLPSYQARFGLKKPTKTNTHSPETVFENPNPSPSPTPTPTLTPIEDQLPPEQTLALQTELLQLHVLHSQGLQTKAKWEANAEKHYRKLHESVKASYRREQEKHRYRNFQAVKRFEEKSATSSSGHDFAIQIGILSRVIQEVTHLTESEDSQYNTVVGVFEEWTQHVTKLKQSRQLKGDDDDVNSDKVLLNADEDGDLQFIEPLPLQWKEDIAALSMQLSQLSGNLDDLDIPKPGADKDKYGKEIDYSDSALVGTVTGHKSLVASMAEELDMIHRIEMEVMEFEILWMERALESVGGAAEV